MEDDDDAPAYACSRANTDTVKHMCIECALRAPLNPVQIMLAVAVAVVAVAVAAAVAAIAPVLLLHLI